MTLDTGQTAERMMRVLVDEIRQRRPELLEKPFTVAEIYQDLVPYRTHRDRIGVEMNGDYEDALLRLLAGEGEYLEVQSEAARRELRKELESVNPDTGLYREFAAVEVRLDPDRIEDLDELPSLEVASDPGPERDAGRRRAIAPGAAADRTGWSLAEAGEGPEGEGGEPGSCRWCQEPLPDRDDLRFCPFCGAGVNVVPCPDCGAELDEEWRFCVACGTEVPPA
ncbi:MAG TPA: zinc ribbon domain-containing protein [Longimicrobiales bacterium]|nr:zinc ribbon domain-containing protein [Longimicrobiales bacterium]